MATSLRSETRRERRLPQGKPRDIFRQARLDEHLPADHRLSTVYRIGAGVTGLALLVFGVVGLTEGIGFFAKTGETVFGLRTNGALSALSIVVGLLLFGGMLRGGNFASTLNLVLGALFVLSGFANMAVLETDLNVLAFGIQNVLFSFVVGLMLLTFGMYGRVSGRLPPDNPYWRARHPEAESDRRYMAEAERRRQELNRAQRATPPARPGSPGLPAAQREESPPRS